MPVTQQYAMRMVGRPVEAHHVNGTIHRGILHSVTQDGIYLRPMTAGHAASNDKDVSAEHAINSEGATEELVFWPFFFPFFALAALWPWGWWW